MFIGAWDSVGAGAFTSFHGPKSSNHNPDYSLEGDFEQGAEKGHYRDHQHDHGDGSTYKDAEATVRQD